MGTEFLRIAEVAVLLGMSKQAVKWRIARGELPYRRWGRSILISRHDLKAFLDELPGVTAGAAVSACCEESTEPAPLVG